MHYNTEQENFWATEFGKEYVNRNNSEKLLASNLSFFSKCLKQTSDLKSCIEIGANIGMNIKALKLLFPSMKFHAVEINSDAAKILSETLPSENITNDSILNYETENKWDLVLSKGVLIHINPEKINQVYSKLYNLSNRYILLGEYYNPTPVEITYRGHTDRLYKRDFAGEMMDMFPDLVLSDYGFVYKKDRNFSQDDITWFLLEKTNPSKGV
jgi:spore coat polysaccharide biosynthesis protein SpsF